MLILMNRFSIFSVFFIPIEKSDFLVLRHDRRKFLRHEISFRFDLLPVAPRLLLCLIPVSDVLDVRSCQDSDIYRSQEIFRANEIVIFRSTVIHKISLRLGSF